MSTQLFRICNRLAVLMIVASIIGCGAPGSNSQGAGQAEGAAASPQDDRQGAGIPLGENGQGPARSPGADEQSADRGEAGARGLGEGGTSGRGATAEASGLGEDGTSGLGATADLGTAAAAPTVLFIGTSLTAGLGLPQSRAFPALIEERIAEAGLPHRVVNAGVSGETSAGALRRIDWLLRQPFDVVVLETGANDMLRGVDPATTESNIQAIIDRLRAARPDAPIVLAGMLALPNLGPAYGRDFEAVYPRLARRNNLALIPFLLDGVGGERHLNQSDGIHPNAAGHDIVAATVWSVLQPILAEAAERPPR